MGSIYKRLPNGDIDTQYSTKFSLESQVLDMQEYIYAQEERIEHILNALETLAKASKETTLMQAEQIDYLEKRIKLLEKTSGWQDKDLSNIDNLIQELQDGYNN